MKYVPPPPVKQMAMRAVREVYPSANTSKEGKLWFIRDGKNDLGVGNSKKEAWLNAQSNLKI